MSLHINSIVFLATTFVAKQTRMSQALSSINFKAAIALSALTILTTSTIDKWSTTSDKSNPEFFKVTAKAVITLAANILCITVLAKPLSLIGFRLTFPAAFQIFTLHFVEKIAFYSAHAFGKQSRLSLLPLQNERALQHLSQETIWNYKMHFESHPELWDRLSLNTQIAFNSRLQKIGYPTLTFTYNSTREKALTPKEACLFSQLLGDKISSIEAQILFDHDIYLDRYDLSRETLPNLSFEKAQVERLSKNQLLWYHAKWRFSADNQSMIQERAFLTSFLKYQIPPPNCFFKYYLANHIAFDNLSIEEKLFLSKYNASLSLKVSEKYFEHLDSEQIPPQKDSRNEQSTLSKPSSPPLKVIEKASKNSDFKQIVLPSTPSEARSHMTLTKVLTCSLTIIFGIIATHFSPLFHFQSKAHAFKKFEPIETCPLRPPPNLLETLSKTIKRHPKPVKTAKQYFGSNTGQLFEDLPSNALTFHEDSHAPTEHIYDARSLKEFDPHASNQCQEGDQKSWTFHGFFCEYQKVKKQPCTINDRDKTWKWSVRGIYCQWNDISQGEIFHKKFSGALKGGIVFLVLLRSFYLKKKSSASAFLKKMKIPTWSTKKTL